MTMNKLKSFIFLLNKKMNHSNYEEYRNTLAKQLKAERAKDYKDYEKDKREIEEASDTFIQILNSNTKPENISDEDRKDYLNAAIDAVNRTKSKKLEALTKRATQQDRIFMILKYHQDHDPYYAPAKKLSRTKRQINKIKKNIADEKGQLETLNTTINEQQERLDGINARIKEVLLSTPKDEVIDIILNKLTEIKLDKKIIKNIKKAISATSRNGNGIITLNKKHRDEWFKGSKDFKLQDGIQKILWEFLIQVEWHSITPNPTSTNATKTPSRNTSTPQEQTSEKSEKEKADEQRKNELKKDLEKLQKMEEPDAKGYITLYQKIFNSPIDNIEKWVKQLEEALKKRTDLSLRTAIESDLLQRINTYPQLGNLEKRKWTDNYRISFCNKKLNLLLSSDFKIIWVFSYKEYKKFEKNN